MFGVLEDLVLVFRPSATAPVNTWEVVFLYEVPRWIMFDAAKSIKRNTTAGAPMVLTDIYRIALEYGKNWSGPGRDVTGPSRARSDLKEAHLSNFLHPVIYCFRMPSEKECANLHLLEDFHVAWDSKSIHVQPLISYLTATFNNFCPIQAEPTTEKEEECDDPAKYPSVQKRLDCYKSTLKIYQEYETQKKNELHQATKGQEWVIPLVSKLSKESEAKKMLQEKKKQDDHLNDILNKLKNGYGSIDTKGEAMTKLRAMEVKLEQKSEPKRE
jgi:hypothetical protein